ncbi:MAG: energy transducer TonB [Deltaproteobacteria bacterium]|nr:energy transducer TonB [Deltaproteobacteria bacterium]
MTERPTTVRYAPPLPFLASRAARAFVLSCGFHLLMLLLLGLPSPKAPPSEPAPIVVSLAPSPNNERGRPAPPPRSAPASARADKAPLTPAKIAKADGPPTLNRHEPVREAAARKEPAAPVATKKDDPVPLAIPTAPATTPRPSPREQTAEKTVIAERELPTVKQLLPPLYSSDGGGGRRSIPLETKEPQYVSYFTSIKRSIDANWKYPELALQYGLQGRLIVEFDILENGHLESLRVIRSSGSALLDDEAVRAIRSAAPFAPIPRWIEQKPLPITARMEYHDGRLTRPTR